MIAVHSNSTNTIQQKKFEKELKDFLETSYAQVIENDVTLIAKKRDLELICFELIEKLAEDMLE